MLQVICGFVVGLLLAGLGFGLVGGGVPGLIVAVVWIGVGALIYGVLQVVVAFKIRKLLHKG